MREMLDKTGVSKLWAASKGLFVPKEAGKGLSENDYIDEEQAAVNALRGTDSANVPLLLQLAYLLGAPGTVDITITDLTTDNCPNRESIRFEGLYRCDSWKVCDNLNIPRYHYTAGPTSVGVPGWEYYSRPGGFIAVINIGSLSGYGTNQGVGYGTYTTTGDTKYAFFLDARGEIYFCTRYLNSVLRTGPDPVTDVVYNYTWSAWRRLSWNTCGVGRGIITLTDEKTATEEAPVDFVDIQAMVTAPYTGGYIIGPVCAALTPHEGYMAATSGTFPAGTYYYEIF